MKETGIGKHGVCAHAARSRRAAGGAASSGAGTPLRVSALIIARNARSVIQLRMPSGAQSKPQQLEGRYQPQYEGGNSGGGDRQVLTDEEQEERTRHERHEEEADDVAVNTPCLAIRR